MSDESYIAHQGPVPIDGILTWTHTPIEGGELIDRRLVVYLNGVEAHPILEWSGKEIDDWIKKVNGGLREEPDVV